MGQGAVESVGSLQSSLRDKLYVFLNVHRILKVKSVLYCRNVSKALIIDLGPENKNDEFIRGWRYLASSHMMPKHAIQEKQFRHF